jgi:ATP-binding cassette, subfamily G (WHITE), eye pigment precursor transporter
VYLATSAFELVKTLRGLAERNGQGFVMVVHQPRTIIFELMDNLLLLSKGEEVYSGHPSGARRVLESCPIIGRPLPDQTNVADFIIDMIKVDENRLLVSNAGGEGSIQNGSRLLPRHWVTCKNDLENAVSSDNLQKKRMSRSVHKLSSIFEIKNSVPKYTAPFLVQLTLLAKRAVKQSRGERISRASLVTTVIFIVFECAFWFQMKNDTNHSYNRYSLLFFMIIAQANGVVVASIPTFKRDTALLSRERAKKMYQVFPYFLGRSFADLTATIFLPCVHSIPVYWVTNLRPRADSFILFSCMYYLTITTAQSLGLLLSTVFPSLQMALVVTPAISIFMMIVAGYYIPLSNMSAWMAWSKYISFCTYGYSSLLVIEFDGRDIPCASDVVLSIGDSTECPLPGKEILNSLGITGLLSNIWFNAIILIFMQVAFRCGAYLMVRRSR